MENGWRELWKSDGIDRGPERTNRSPSFSSSVGFPDGRRQVSSDSQQSQGSQSLFTGLISSPSPTSPMPTPVSTMPSVAPMPTMPPTATMPVELVQQLSRIEEQLGQMGKGIRVDEQMLRFSRMEEQLGRLLRMEEQMVRIEDKIEDGFRKTKELVDDRNRKSMDQMVKLSDRQSSLEEKVSKRQSSLEEKVTQKQSVMEANLETGKGSLSQVTRTFEIAFERFEERMLDRQSTLYESVDSRKGIDEVVRRVDAAVDTLEAKLDSRASRTEEQLLQSISRNRGEVLNSLRDSFRETIRAEKLDKQEIVAEINPSIEDSTSRLSKILDESMTSLVERSEKQSDSLRKSVQADLGTIAKRCELMAEAMRSRTEVFNEHAAARQVSGDNFQRSVSAISVEDLPVNDGYHLNELKVSVDNGFQFLSDRLLVLHRELMEIYGAVSRIGEGSRGLGASSGAGHPWSGLGGTSTPGMLSPNISAMPMVPQDGMMAVAIPGMPQVPQAPQAPQVGRQCQGCQGCSQESQWPQGQPGGFYQEGLCQGAPQQEPSFDLLDSGEESPPPVMPNHIQPSGAPGAQVQPIVAQAARTAMELDELMREARAPGTRRRPRTAEHNRPQLPQSKAASPRRPQTAERQPRRRDMSDHFGDSRHMDMRRRPGNMSARR